MSQASGSDVSASAQLKPKAENDANCDGRSGVSENKDHVRKDGQNVNASFGTSSQTSYTTSDKDIQKQTKNLSVDKQFSEKFSMMPQKVLPELEKNAQQSSEFGCPGNERAAVHSLSCSTSGTGQLKTHSSGDKLPEAMETSMKGSGETWQPPTCTNDMNDVEMEDVEEKKSQSLKPDKTPEDQRNYRAEGAVPKTETDRKPQKPWKEFFVIVKRAHESELLKQVHGSDFEILEKCSAKDRELSPVKMQYLIQYHFDELLKTFDVDLQKMMHNMKTVQCNSQCLLFDVRSAPTQGYIDEIIVCLQDTANKVNYFQRFPASKALSDNPETVLKEFILSGQIAVYRDEEATYVVGIVEDNKIITEKLKMMLVDESMNSNYHTTTVELKMDIAGQLLKTFGFIEHLNIMQPNTTCLIDEENHTISFRGRQTEVESAANEVGKFFRGLVNEDIPLKPMYSKLLVLPKVNEFLVDKCRKQNLKVFWTVPPFNNRITCYMLNKSGVQLFLDMLKQNFVMYYYPIRSHSPNEISFSSTKMFVDFVDAHYTVNLVSLVEGNNICIATIKDVGRELVIMEAKHTDKKSTDDSKKSVDNGKSQGLTRQEGNVEAFDEEEHSIEAKNLWEFQKIQMLKKFNFVQQIKRNIPDIKIAISDQLITFVGVEANKVKQEIANFISKLNTQTVDKIPSAVLNFCKTSEVAQQSIASSFDKNGILCHWFVNDDCDCLYVFALDSPTLTTAISHILKTVSWVEYTSTDEVKFIFKSQEITSFLEKWKHILKVDDIECDDFMVYGITEAVEGFRTCYDSKMEELVKQQMLVYPKSGVKVVRHRLGARKDVVEFFTKHEHSAWKSFLNDNCIEVQVDDGGEVLLVGEENQVKNAAREFNRKARLTRKKWSCDVNYPTEVVQKLKVDTVPSIEREFKVSLTVENDTNFFKQQQLGQWVDWNTNIHVALVHGQVYEMVADVLVCPTNGSFSPSSLATIMLEKGGIIMKNDFFQKRTKQANAIYVSSYTGNLPCLMVAYLAVPEYRPSVTMQSEVKKCIQELILTVDKAQLQSIVIPVKILDHIPETTFLHWFASAFIAIHNQLNFLKQIYLCTDLTKNTELFVEALSSALPKYLNFYNFSHMCGEIGRENAGAVIPIDMKIELVTGMLVEQKVDVIVNSCNRELDLAKGAVSSTIMDKGGQSILRECHDNYPNGIDYGNVVVSSAGNMKFHMICHGALPFWTPAAKLSLQLLAKLVFDCLLEAEKQNCRSIAFPVFGTGNLGYPWDEVARTMLDTINKYGTLRSGITTVKEVKIVLYEKDVKSIKAFESRKRQIEEIKLITEDPEIPPQLILEARCQNVRVQVIPLSDTKCHQCEAVVKILSFAETTSLTKKNPQSKLLTDGILTEKFDGENFWTVTVYSDEQEKNYKEATSRALKFATKERIGTLAVCMMHGSGKTLRFKDQASIIRDLVKDLEKNRYMQVVKIIVPDREKFDLMLSTTITKQDEESKKWLQKVGEYVFKLNKHQWKCVSYLNVIESPRILVTALVDDEKCLDKLKDKLESEVVKVVRQGKQFLGVTIKQDVEKRKQTEKKNWVRCFNTNRGVKQISLSEDICSQIDNAIKFNYPNVEIKDGDDVFVYKIDDFTYYVIGKEDVRGFFMKELKDDPDDPPEKERKTESKKVQSNEDIFATLEAEVVCNKQNESLIKKVEAKFKMFDMHVTKQSEGRWNIKSHSGNLKDFDNLNDTIMNRASNQNSTVFSSTQKPNVLKKGEFSQSQHKKKSAEASYEHLTVFKLSPLEFKMLKFFCEDSQIFIGRYEYKDGVLMRYLNPTEKEANLQTVFKSKMDFIRSLTSSTIASPSKISDEKFHEIERAVSDTKEIYCERSENKEMITLYASNYEKMGEGKHKAEVALGLKQQSKGRRNRVFVTDNDFSSSKKEPASASGEQSVKRPVDFSKSLAASSGPRIEMTFKTSEGIIIKVYNGNILSLDVDCIVNAANENLNHGGGVAYVIAAAAGYDFEKESDDYIQQNGPINEGSCCTTSAGKLKYKSVIHTVGPKWHAYNDKRECCRILKKSVECCFFEAEVNGMSSVAIPSISAGIFGVPKEVCCKEYSKAVEDFSRKNGNTTCLKEIHFIDKDAGMISMIQKEFSQIFNQISSSNTGSSSGFSAGGQGRITRSMSSPDDPEVTKGKTQIRNDNFAGSVSKFQKQFLFKKDLKVVVVQEDIIKMNVNTIVCPQDENISNKGAIARAIANVCDYSYDQSVKALKWIIKSETKNVKASPASVPFKYVLHTVPPRYDKYAEASRVGFDLDLERTIRNILRHCNLKEVTSVAMPVLGIGKDGLGTPVSVFAKIFLVVLQEEIKYAHKFNIKEINIVTNDIAAASTIADEFGKEKVFTEVTSFSRSRNKGDKGYKKPDTTQDTKMAMAGKTFKGKLTDGDENCIICTEPNTRPHQLTCGHVFCKNCVQEFLKVKPVCPTCGSIQGVIKGDQPPGTMNRREMRYSLSGFTGYSTIEIEYEIYSGKQGEQHPNPGKYFKGIKRTAYLPNTKKGKLIADLLKIAFDRRLVFTIGHSRTTGEEGVVTWNDIHHKTSMTKGHQFGYPDEGYFDRVLDELKIKGVTEEDL